MAKIIYYKNPLDKKEFKEIEIKESVTIKEILEKEGLGGKPLCIVINKEIPEEVSLNYKINKEDNIEVIAFVEGDNATWATIVDVVTVVTVIALASTGFGLAAVGAVLATGALISGALRANISQPKLEQSGVQLSGSSPTTAANTSREYQPFPIVLGSIRVAPDLYTDRITTRPLKWYNANIAGNPFYNQLDYSWDLPIYGGYPFPIPFPRRVDKEQTSFSAQTFCFGFGDLEINNRKIGNVTLDDNLTARSTFAPYDSGYNDSFGFRRMNDFVGTSEYGTQSYIPMKADFDFEIAVKPNAPTTVRSMKSVQLTNIDAPSTMISENDQRFWNWNYFEGGKGQDVFQFAITGTIYSQNEGGVGQNHTTIELQARKSGESEWSAQYPPTYNIIGNTTSPIYTFFSYRFWATITPEDTLQVRVRKVTRDTDDNSTGSTTFVSRLSVTDACFFESQNANKKNNEYFGKSKFPMIIEGVAINNTITTDGASINNYSALVDAKCYVFEDDNWTWKKTRNPAWWFLYFARGGFNAIESRGSNDVENQFPFSPTWFWQNYAGHSKNTELIFGGGYTDDKIDIEKIKEWARFCDENELKIDLVLREQSSVAEQLEKIASIGRGSVNYDLGKLSVIYEDKNQVPVAMFGMGNIIAGSFSSNYISKENYGRIVASFANRENDFEVEEIEVNIPFADPLNMAVSEISLEGVTEYQQAQREANLIAARQFFQRKSYSWKSDHEGFLARRGDLVYISHDSTQFGFSGRVIEFILNEDDQIIGFIPSSNIDELSIWCMIRLPNGEMKSLSCRIEDKKVYFEDDFSLNDGPYYIKNQTRESENKKSRFFKSYSGDFIYIADIKETTGKLVRISSVETDENQNFTYNAVDEDQALWAFEYGIDEDSTSGDDSVGTIEAIDPFWSYLDNEKVKLIWSGSEDCLFMIIDEGTEMPIDINGRFSFSNKEVILELEKGVVHNLRIVPIKISEKVTSRSARVKI